MAINLTHLVRQLIRSCLSKGSWINEPGLTPVNSEKLPSCLTSGTHEPSLSGGVVRQQVFSKEPMVRRHVVDSTLYKEN